MLKKIFISILGLENINISIDIENESILSNNNLVKYDKSLVESIINMVVLWKYDYGEDASIDSEKFMVELITDKERIVYKGKGIFPDNYQLFKEILGELLWQIMMLF